MEAGTEAEGAVADGGYYVGHSLIKTNKTSRPFRRTNSNTECSSLAETLTGAPLINFNFGGKISNNSNISSNSNINGDVGNNEGKRKQHQQRLYAAAQQQQQQHLSFIVAYYGNPIQAQTVPTDAKPLPRIIRPRRRRRAATSSSSSSAASSSDLYGRSSRSPDMDDDNNNDDHVDDHNNNEDDLKHLLPTDLLSDEVKEEEDGIWMRVVDNGLGMEIAEDAARTKMWAWDGGEWQKTGPSLALVYEPCPNENNSADSSPSPSGSSNSSSFDMSFGSSSFSPSSGALSFSLFPQSGDLDLLGSVRSSMVLRDPSEVLLRPIESHQGSFSSTEMPNFPSDHQLESSMIPTVSLPCFFGSVESSPVSTPYLNEDSRILAQSSASELPKMSSEVSVAPSESIETPLVSMQHRKSETRISDLEEALKTISLESNVAISRKF